jgi:hypothetical protein
MTKTAAKVSETDYRFDSLIFKKGEKNNVVYYSRYPWQSSTGTYLENSTADSDYLNVSDEEYNLMIEKAKEIAGEEVDEMSLSESGARNYKTMSRDYQRANPSQAMNIISTYADFKHT